MNETIEPHNGSPAERAEPDRAQTAGLTAEQLEECRRYGREGLVCDMADRCLDVAYLAVMAFVFARPLDAWLCTCPVLSRLWTLRLAVMFLIVIGLHIAVSVLLSFYRDHVLEHRYALSNQTLGGWLGRYFKRNVLAVAVGLMMYPGLYWIIRLTGPYWWLAAAGAYFAVIVIFGQLAPVLIIPLFYKIERLDMPELADRMTRLTRGTGLSIEGVYRMGLSEETKKANAMLAGLGRTRRVLLGDTVIANFSLDEIEVIFAHEIGHHVFHHIRKMIAAGAVYSVVWFWICDRVIAAWVAAGDGRFDYARLPVYTLPLLMLIITVLSNLIEPLQNTISRRYERQCDRYALEKTGLRDAFVSAFEKLSRLNKDDPRPSRLEVVLLHSHPPIGERLEMAKNSANNN